MKVVVATALGLICLADPIAAQTPRPRSFAEPIGIHQVSVAGDRTVHWARSSSAFAQRSESSRAGLYFLSGAAIGALALGGYAAYELSQCSDDCMLAGPMLGIAVGAGAVAGGLGGLIVYALHRQSGNAAESRH
jgi:hypothetical protein